MSRVAWLVHSLGQEPCRIVDYSGRTILERGFEMPRAGVRPMRTCWHHLMMHSNVTDVSLMSHWCLVDVWWWCLGCVLVGRWREEDTSESRDPCSLRRPGQSTLNRIYRIYVLCDDSVKLFILQSRSHCSVQISSCFKTAKNFYKTAETEARSLPAVRYHCITITLQRQCYINVLPSKQAYLDSSINALSISEYSVLLLHMI